MNDLQRSTANLNKVAFLGAGSMGGAILRGLVQSNLQIEQFAATVRGVSGAAKLDDLGDVVEVLIGDENPNANRQAASGADVIFIGVKPAQVVEVLADISDVVAEDAIVVSLAAGTTITSCESALRNSARSLPAVIRAMPNTPALIRQGMTGLAAGASVTAEQLGLAEQIFDTVGRVLVLDEDQIDALSTISGSGPAYVFLLIEELTKAALALGFEASDAALLAEQTFLGAVNLQSHTQTPPADLRAQVTSSKGTTERAIAVLEQAKLGELFFDAAQAALARARELAAGSA